VLKPTKQGVNVLLIWVAVAIVALGTAAPALAYVGPGAGLSLVGAFWGLLVAIFAAFAFVILWPIRRMFRRRRQAGAMPPRTAEAGESGLLPSEQRNT
jgi:uncharacterized membrane protein